MSLKDLAFTTEEKERLQILDNMPDVALYRCVRGVHTDVIIFDYVSNTWEKLTGVSAERTTADFQNVFVNILPDDLELLKKNIYKSSGAKYKFEIEIRYRHPVTEKIHWFQIFSYIRHEDEHVISDGFIFDITVRKEVEQKFLAEKERLESLGNNLPDGALLQFIRDRKSGLMRISYISGRWEEVTGIASDIAMSSMETIFAMIHPDDLPSVMHAIDDSAQATTNFCVEFRISARSRSRWIKMSAHPHVDDTSIIWDGIVLDVTARKETERELETEKNRLQMLGDNLPGSALYQFVRDTRTGQMSISYVSGTWETVSGLPADVALADISKVFDVVAPDDLPAFIQSIDDSARTMTDFIFETRFGEHWVHIIARPRREGVCIVWDGIMTNITRRKETERELEDEKNRLKMLGDNLPNSSLFQFVRDTRTRQMRFSYVSATWETITRVSAEATLTDVTKLFSAIPPDKFPLFLQSIENSARTMSDFIHELYMNERWIHIVARPRPDDALIVWDGIITDISERKKNEAELTKYRENLEYLVQERTDELNTANEELYATNEELYATNEELHNKNVQIAEEITVRMENERELEQYRTQLEQMVEQKTAELLLAKEKAEESDRLKSAFLANMSHEIRTPLNGIVGFLQFIDSDDLAPWRRKEYIKVVNISSKQLAKIIDDIIDISKIEAGQMTICPIPVQLNPLMHELQMLFETYLHASNKEHIELILDDSGFIDDCVIYVDTVRLRQVFNNLISNAVKFTEKGYIRFGYRQSAPNQLEFMVEDTGIGLAPDQQEVIFERFRQAETGSNRQYGGTGLGLTISRSLVQMKGGKIWVESIEDEGASFYFTIAYLPIAPEDMRLFEGGYEGSSLYDAATNEVQQESVSRFAGKSVLVVEPTQIRFNYYEKLISATGAAVTKVETLQQWREITASPKSFDMVIADASLLDNEGSGNIPNLPTALVVPEENEKYRQFTGKKVCVIEVPVSYAKVLEIMEKYAG